MAKSEPQKGKHQTDIHVSTSAAVLSLALSFLLTTLGTIADGSAPPPLPPPELRRRSFSRARARSC